MSPSYYFASRKVAFDSIDRLNFPQIEIIFMDLNISDSFNLFSGRIGLFVPVYIQEIEVEPNSSSRSQLNLTRLPAVSRT